MKVPELSSPLATLIQLKNPYLTHVLQVDSEYFDAMEPRFQLTPNGATSNPNVFILFTKLMLDWIAPVQNGLSEA